MRLAKPTPPTPEQLTASFRQLIAAAEVLDEASRELSQPVAILDEGLARLGLGITAWETVKKYSDPQSASFDITEVGYTKVGSTWGVAIRRSIGHEFDPENEDSTTWLFDGAPRHLRIDAIDFLPSLIDTLIKFSDKTAKKLREKAAQVTDLVTVLAPLFAEMEEKKKGRTK